jgi:protein-glutamine gamma-glutamyltransferase
LKKPIGEGRLITQNIFLEPIDTPVIFGLSELIAVQGSFSGIETNAEDSYRILRGGFERRNYLATSLLRDVNPNKLREDSKNYRYEESRYLQVPPTLDSRIGQLAEEVVSALTDRNIYDSAKSIENHLQTSYGYTLEQKASGEQPLADFLFNVREGHCEYFATAMAVMLRTQGIATRVVNGFQTGEFNPTTGYFTVRQRDAHSWVEVYFPDSDQWVAFDPTPPAGLGRADEVGAFASLRRLTDTIETLWIQYFISYDSVGQRGVLVSLWGQFAGVQKNLTLLMDATVSGIEGIFFASSEGDSKEGDLSNGISIVVFILVLIGSILLLTKVIAHQRSRRTENKGKGPPGFYRELVAILAKSGSTRRASQTPMEFAEETGLREAVELTAIYHRIRFGERTLDRSTHERIKALLRDLRKALNAS